MQALIEGSEPVLKWVYIVREHLESSYRNYLHPVNRDRHLSRSKVVVSRGQGETFKPMPVLETLTTTLRSNLPFTC